MKQVGYITNDIAEMVHRRNPCCAWCGYLVRFEKRGTDWNVDHLIPQAVAKWAPVVDPGKFKYHSLMRVINHYDNLAVMHPNCNKLKGNYIIRVRKDSQYHNLNDEQVHYYRKVRRRINDAVNAYQNLINTVWCRQNKQCYVCKQHLNQEDVTLRRIDSSIPRSKENVCGVCIECNEHMVSIRKKILPM